MTENSTTVQLSLDSLLRDSKKQATSMSLPFAVHYKLDALAELAAAAHATRAEIIGMLIAQAELDSAQLEDGILRYRKKTVGDVLSLSASEDADSNVIELPVRQPGRPRTNRAS